MKKIYRRTLNSCAFPIKVHLRSSIHRHISVSSATTNNSAGVKFDSIPVLSEFYSVENFAVNPTPSLPSTYAATRLGYITLNRVTKPVNPRSAAILCPGNFPLKPPADLTRPQLQRNKTRLTEFQTWPRWLLLFSWNSVDFLVASRRIKLIVFEEHSEENRRSDFLETDFGEFKRGCVSGISTHSRLFSCKSTA